MQWESKIEPMDVSIVIYADSYDESYEILNMSISDSASYIELIKEYGYRKDGKKFLFDYGIMEGSQIFCIHLRETPVELWK